MLTLLKRVVEKVRSKFLNLYERYSEEEASSLPAWWYYVLSFLEDIWIFIADFFESPMGISLLITVFLVLCYCLGLVLGVIL